MVLAATMIAGGCGDGAPAPSDGSAAASLSEAGPGSASGTTTSAVSLDVGVEYPRYLQTHRRLEVTVVNDGTTPVTVMRLTLRAPQFPSTQPVSKDDVIDPGRRVDLQTDFGVADCSVDPDAAAVADLRLRPGAGPPMDVTVDLPTATLADIHTDECGRRAVETAVELTVGSQWQRSDEGIAGEFVLRRRPGASSSTITVSNVGGSVIFIARALPDDRVLPVRLAPGDDETRLPVEIVASRCDPHAVAESKKTYLFPLWIEVGAAPAQYVTVDAEPTLRPALDELIDECMASQRS